MLSDGIRNTIALCPVCYRQVQARTEGLTLELICPVHGKRSGVVEIDKDFVKEIGYNRTADPFDSLMINITDVCNTKCRLCYYPCKSGHRSYEDIVELCVKHPNHKIWFSGGEPTTHPDIFKLMRQPNFSICLTNGLLFSSIYFIHNYVQASELDNEGNVKAVFSLHTSMPPYKYQALRNLRQLGLRINCAMFSITAVDELVEILNIWDEFHDVIQHIRIRCPFNSWEQKADKKLYNSSVYRTLRALTPAVPTDELGGNSIYSVTLKFYSRYITLCCAPHYTAFDIDALQYAPKMMALDGGIYPIPHGLIVNERVQYANL